MTSRTSLITAWCIGAAVSLAFIGLSIVKLDGQGMYYDEIHQAPAAFFYLGQHPRMFIYPVFGIPVLNMSYSGAIKTTLYGLYMRLAGVEFTVKSWRLLGILLVAAGLLLFYRKAGVWLPAESSILFGGLVLTDTSVLLMTRHDYGPVALSLALRLAFLGIWVASEWKPTAAQYFAGGLIAGVAVFEKLSAIVLVIPLGMFLWRAGKRAPHGLLMGAAGFAAGCAPLALVNLASLLRGAGLVSISDVTSSPAFQLQQALSQAREYLALGHGVAVRGFVLGESSGFAPSAELLLMLALLFIVGVGALRWTANVWMKVAGLCASAWVLIGVLLFLMPQITSIHHWILGTPFQYVAIVAALAAFSDREAPENALRSLGHKAVIVVVIALIAVRLPNIVAVEQSLAMGKASAEFDPDFTKVADLAAARSGDAVFVSADWGTATQIYCVGKGRANFVYEPYWDKDPSASMLEIMKTTAAPSLYLIVARMEPRFEKASAAILQTAMSAADWQEVPVEREFAALHRIQVRKFVRRN